MKKFPATTFPLAFTLSAADMPFQNGAFDGELVLTRAHRSGRRSAEPRRRATCSATLPKVRSASKNVRLTLDQVQKETESLAAPGGPMGGGHARR